MVTKEGGEPNQQPTKEVIIDGEVKAAVEAERLYYTQFLKAQEMVLSDRPTKPVDAAIFFGRSWFDAEKSGVYQLLVDFYRSGKAKYIVIYGSRGQRFGDTKPNAVAPSHGFARARLVKMEVADDSIINAPLIDSTKNNTLEQGKAFLRTAGEYNFKNLVVIDNPHQLLREMLGLIATIDKQEEFHPQIWTAAPTSTDWQKRVMGAQGEHLGPRSDHIDLENGRIRKYQDSGDLASFQRFFDYVNTRGR